MTDYKLTLRSTPEARTVIITVIPKDDVAPYLKGFYSAGGILEDIQKVKE
tara:strand:+ start:380 stop:529 length:150 start_codon:yes stop_codon:yes gene_type:complete